MAVLSAAVATGLCNDWDFCPYNEGLYWKGLEQVPTALPRAAHALALYIIDLPDAADTCDLMSRER